MCFLIFSYSIVYNLTGQELFRPDPYRAEFITTDYEHFWHAYDSLDISDVNPFEGYLQRASPGLAPLVQYIDVNLFYETVVTRKKDYLKTKDVIDDLGGTLKRVEASYAALEYWYPDAVYPPVFFAVGMFTVGGTISENGLLVGVELLEDVDALHGLVAHELIHFQQQVKGEPNLLTQSIIEGSADFIGELISGVHVNLEAFEYGETHETSLCQEFKEIMKGDDFEDWLYGTSGKDNRPKDLGYWIGYKIVESYYHKQKNKRAAISGILNIDDTQKFLEISGYLNAFNDEE